MVGTQCKQSSSYKPFSWLSTLSDALASIGSVLCAIVVTSLAALTLLVSAHFPFVEGSAYSERLDFTTPFISTGVGAAIVTAACACVLFVLIFFFWRTRIGRIKPMRLLIAVLVWVFLFQMAWILSLHAQAFGYADSVDLADAASAYLSGDLSSFVLSGPVGGPSATATSVYFHMYPYQSGSFYIFVFMKILFGEQYVQWFQVLNAICNCVVVCSLFSMSKSLGASKQGQNVCLLLCGTCFPLLFSCSFVYGNSIGLAFSFTAIALLMGGLAQADRRKKLIRISISFALVAIAIMAKGTCVLYLIVMVCILLLEAMKRLDAPLAGITLACALVAYQISGVPLHALESQTGEDYGQGVPRTSWIAMGLRDDNPLEMPGWWSSYAYEVLLESGGGYDDQVEVGTNDIKDSLQDYLEHPDTGVRFFGTKLASEWSDPSFQSLYYASLSTNRSASDGAAAEVDGAPASHNYGRLARTTLYGTMHEPVLLFMDAFQDLVMVFTALYVIRLCKKKNRKENQSLKLVLPLVVFMGFFVYLFWEAKSVYLMPFFIAMVPLAAIQIDSGCEWLEHYFSRPR